MKTDENERTGARFHRNSSRWPNQVKTRVSPLSSFVSRHGTEEKDAASLRPDQNGRSCDAILYACSKVSSMRRTGKIEREKSSRSHTLAWCPRVMAWPPDHAIATTEGLHGMQETCGRPGVAVG